MDTATPTSPARTFAIANINPGEIKATTVQSMLSALDAFHYNRVALDPYMSNLILTHSGPYLDDGRNKCVQRFLNDTTADILLFLDSDVECTPAHIRRILAHDYTLTPVVSGYYRSLFADGWSPVVYWMQQPDPNNLRPGWINDLATDGTLMPEMAPIGDNGWDMLPSIPNTLGLKQAHVVGAGFLAISRTLLTLMGERYKRPCPWFAEAIDTNRLVHMGEDTTFCARVYEMGSIIAVDPTIGLCHTKPIAISPNPSSAGTDTADNLTLPTTLAVGV